MTDTLKILLAKQKHEFIEILLKMKISKKEMKIWMKLMSGTKQTWLK